VKGADRSPGIDPFATLNAPYVRATTGGPSTSTNGTDDATFSAAVFATLNRRYELAIAGARVGGAPRAAEASP
jgi:hypothetical protein